MSAIILANYLRRRMNELRLSNTEVAARAQVSRQTWYRLLNAEVEEAKLSTLVHLSSALHVPPMRLMTLYFEGVLDEVPQHEISRREAISDLSRFDIGRH